MGKSFRLGIILLCASLIIVALFWLRNCTKNDYLEVGADDTIDATPTQIQSIKAICEWEFLSVSLEELTDTVRKGFLSDDELSRIYYGTLRIGINMHQVEPGWLTADGDSVSLILPRVDLLDHDFIDEARTKPFFESGSWKPEDREALYRQAHERMLRHGLTPENLAAAETNAREQITSLMHAIGFQKVNMTFGH
ncbi:MAG: DUF4230 domain-containing protein [Prevotella sp.]|nr:DUF4230 domain-containing protein [Prevotella sp.]